MTTLEWLIYFDSQFSFDFFPSIEKAGSKEFQTKITPPASRSELRRWCNNGSVVIDGKKMMADDEVSFPITEVVLFPKSKHKTTF